MLDLERGTALAVRHALSNFRHKDYDRTTTMAREYTALKTGEDLEFLLRRFDRRESEEDFKQACRIAQHITPSVVSGLTNPARKMPQVKPLVDRCDYGRAEEARAKELHDLLSEFCAGADVDEYLESLVDPSDADPNAYEVLAFGEFDHRKEKPDVFPFRVPSANVYDHGYLNGLLEYLWIGFDIEYVTEEAVIGFDGEEITPAKKAAGKRYVMYLDDHHIMLDQVAETRMASKRKGRLLTVDGEPVELTGNIGVVFSAMNERTPYYLRKSDTEVFEVTFYEQMSGQVPAYRLGCVKDTYTDGRTCVNRWHAALPYLKKLLKQVRELDLSTALHAFPQKIQYISKCKASGCNGGSLADGTTCTTCKGHGFHSIGTAQDHITLPLPKSQEEMLDPAKIVHYVQVPTDIIKVLVDLVKETKAEAFKAVYNADIYGSGNVGKTIEEVLAYQQAIYDALQPFAAWWSTTRTTITKVFASYMDMANGLIVQHKFPRRFGFETEAQTMQLLKSAKESGASKAVKANLNERLVGQVFSDDQETLKKVLTQARFDPFPGMDEGTIMGLISGGNASEKSAFVWTESALIFRQCEDRYPGEMTFYDLNERKQQEVFDEVVKALLEEHEATKATPSVSLGYEEEEEEEKEEEVEQ